MCQPKRCDVVRWSERRVQLAWLKESRTPERPRPGGSAGALDVTGGVSSGGVGVEAESLLELFNLAEGGDTLALIGGLEQRDRLDRHDVHAPRDSRNPVDVDLDDIDLACLLRRELLDLGRDHAARSGPRCPEVDDDEALVVQDELPEGLVGRVLDLADRVSSFRSR